MELNFENFRLLLKNMYLSFEKPWDSEEYNRIYMFFKDWLDRISPKWKEGKDTQTLVREFCDEFFQDATQDTHNYWLKPIKDRVLVSISHQSHECGWIQIKLDTGLEAYQSRKICRSLEKAGEITSRKMFGVLFWKIKP